MKILTPPMVGVEIQTKMRYLLRNTFVYFENQQLSTLIGKYWSMFDQGKTKKFAILFG